MGSFDFTGFVPMVKNIEISSQTSLMTFDGNFIDGYLVKVTFSNDTETIFSLSVEQLQKLFFVILKSI